MKSFSLKKIRLLAVLLAGGLAAFAQQPAAPAEPPLRRIDEPAAAAPAPAADQPPAPTKKKRGRVVAAETDVPFGDKVVPAGKSVREAVSIFGSLEVAGEVRGNAVAVLGSAKVAPGAKIGGNTVAVFGRMEMLGEARANVVSVLGGTCDINGPVGGNVVAVFGNFTLGPKAVVDGNLVVIGGQLARDPDAVVRGSVISMSALGLGDFEWLVTWLRDCAVLGRPLAFGRDLGWAWAIAFGFLGFYVLLALLFPRGVTQCTETFERRPAMSILSAVLTVLLSPVAVVILAITIVGALVVPFLAAALFFAGLFGKVVMLAWLGRRFTKFFGDGPLGGPVFAVLIGGLVLMLVYTIPFVGFTAYKLVSWLGLGVVVLTIAEAMQRNKRPPAAPVVAPPLSPPPPPVPAASAPAAALAAVAPANVPAPVAVEPPPLATEAAVPPEATGPAPAVAGFVAPPPAYMTRAAIPPVPPPLTRPALDETVLPRATLLIRLGALALDGVLVGVILGFLSGLTPRFLHFNDGPGGFLIVLAIYGAALWKTKGTTIGGIICGLKVVRLDGRAIDWPTAAVRALGCFLSLVVAGLGFIWVAFDPEQQSWHDKIAGTIVVRMPKGTPLV
ncbi:MAG: RDD family protein [Opitutaceae bacterium]|nr:RDD family protein [Opitutaceae bacterium]